MHVHEVDSPDTPRAGLPEVCWSAAGGGAAGAGGCAGGREGGRSKRAVEWSGEVDLVEVQAHTPTLGTNLGTPVNLGRPRHLPSSGGYLRPATCSLHT